MSKIVKGVKKGLKKVGKFVKKNWKPILAVAAIAFTGGLATVGFAGLKGAIAANGILGGIGSTMFAGATSMLGTIGIGSGAAGTAAAAAGMQGATLMTGAAAQAMGLASSGLIGPPTAAQAGSASVGAYTGPGSSFMGGGGSLLGGSSQAGQMVQQGVGQMTGGSQVTGGVGQMTGGSQVTGGGGLLKSLAPWAIQAGGAYLANRGQEEADRPKGLWGVDFNGDGFEASQPWGAPNYANPGIAAMRPGGRMPGLIDAGSPYGG